LSDDNCQVVHAPYWSSHTIHSDAVTSLMFLDDDTLITMARASSVAGMYRRTALTKHAEVEPYDLMRFRPPSWRPALEVMGDLDVEIEGTVTVPNGRAGLGPSMALWFFDDGLSYILSPAGKGVRLCASDSLGRGPIVHPDDDPRLVRALAAEGMYAVAVGERGLVRVYTLQKA
jgi:hypothetical protein